MNDTTTFAGADAVGGSGSGAAAVSGNSVTMIAGGQVGDPSGNGHNIIGGLMTAGGSGDVHNNQVTITGGQTVRNTGGDGSVRGGESRGSGAVYDNRVEMSGGRVIEQVYGGYSAESSSANVACEVYENYVHISGGAVLNGVYGGVKRGAATGSTAAGAVRNNHVLIDGDAKVGSAIGGNHFRNAGAVLDNTVTVNGGEVGVGVSGGVAGGTIALNDSGDILRNKVFISGGRVDGIIAGGVHAGTGRANDNLVEISGSPNLALANLYGGRRDGGSGDIFAGNTLNLRLSGLTVQSVQNFQFYNFYLPASLAAGSTVFRVTGTADLRDPNDPSRTSEVNVHLAGAASPLQPGDQITLIDAGSLLGVPANSATGAQGVTLSYQFDLSVASGRFLVATLTGLSVSGAGQALPAASLAGLAFLNQGAELAAGPGLAQAARAALYADEYRLASFAALSGGSSSYGGGSHVSARGLSLMTGLAYGRALEPGRLTLAGFLEYGDGSHSSGDIRGDLRYLGGGLAAGFQAAEAGGLHAEASARAGRLRNDGDLTGALPARYEASAAYYGLHLGGGYIYNLSENSSLDIYGQYLWTRAGGEKTTLTTGDPVSFEAANSRRLRLGGRFAFAAGEGFTPYAGLAWEHEFSGEARAASYGHGIEAPPLKGHTGLAELGFSLRPSAETPLTLELGATGYAGRRRGGAGHLQIKWEF